MYNPTISVNSFVQVDLSVPDEVGPWWEGSNSSCTYQDSIVLSQYFSS